MRNLLIIIILLLITNCRSNNESMTKIVFLHHSTGHAIWVGRNNRLIYKLTGKGDVQRYFHHYNKKNNTNYYITERSFPKSSPYGWNNYPYDYYKIWVKNAGAQPYMEEPTIGNSNKRI